MLVVATGISLVILSIIIPIGIVAGLVFLFARIGYNFAGTTGLLISLVVFISFIFLFWQYISRLSFPFKAFVFLLKIYNVIFNIIGAMFFVVFRIGSYWTYTIQFFLPHDVFPLYGGAEAIPRPGEDVGFR